MNGIQFVHFGLYLSQSPEKHSAFHDPYEQPDLPWHTGEGGGFFSTHPARSCCTNPFLGACWKFPLLGALGLVRSVRALRDFLVPSAQGSLPPPTPPPPLTPAAFPGPDPGRRKFFPSSLGLASRDQPPPLPLPERESLKVTEEISMDTTTGPQECSAGFPAA